jgi:uncharacterized membrane protein
MRKLRLAFMRRGVFASQNERRITMGFVKFMSSTTGRWTRGIAGAALIALGLIVGGGAAWVFVALGAVFVAVGVLDVCLIAPLLKKPFSGKAFRTKAS